MKKYMKLIICSLLAVITVINTGCSSPSHYTSRKELISLFEDAGYEITESDHVGEFDDLNRVQAKKGDSYIDICYEVEESECLALCDELSILHPDSKLTGYNAGKKIVYCFSDNTAFKVSKFKLIAEISADVEPIELAPIKIN